MGISTVLRTITANLMSVVGSQTNAEAVYVGGNPVSVQFLGPAALNRAEVSVDGMNWAVATAEVAASVADLTAVTGGLFDIREQANFVRHSILADASGPRLFTAAFMVKKGSV